MKKLTVFRHGLWLLLLLAGLAGCVEPYAPEVINAPPNLLVVEGFINADGPTSIRLSRTITLAQTTLPPPETNAQLAVEVQNGPSYPLRETAPGTYTGAPLSLPAGSLCRLRISTAKGQQYASDFVPVKRTPPIDELQWKAQESGFNFYLSTQDPTGNSQFYRWEYDETWEIIPTYQPNIGYYDTGVGTGKIDTIRSRPYPYPFRCWVSEQSNKVVVSRTSGLSQDQVRDFRLRVLPLNSERLFSRYSLRVRQQVLTREEYDYWQLLAKNTENIGSLFDAQPSQLTGNVRSLDEAGGQQALGFVGAHSVSEKRIFVDRTDLPAGSNPLTGYESCSPLTLLNLVEPFPPPPPEEKAQTLYGAFHDGSFVPIFEVAKGVEFASRDCVDCRTRGTTVRPDFW
ncbi:DUF4249 domain-containing protein [Hymenobacter aerophilus]|uniref:DUF4249 domain-containing protein n=1 Tax=Hymenobacter aerophilus TaxID=119644 RepID=UPI0003AAC2A2|nr:DUF4249 domain-containing protein [Hymenobacter aerophilus]